MNWGHQFQVAPSRNRPVNRILITFCFLMTKVGGSNIWHPGGVKSGAETQAAALGIGPRMGLLTKWMEKGEIHLLCVGNLMQQHLLVLAVTLPSQSKLQQLDLDQIRSQITKFDKYVDQLEEGLPKNSVVSSLKDKMEVMRHMVGS